MAVDPGVGNDACRRQARQADAAPAEYRLNEAFALGGGQQASITGEDLSLRFTDVLEDSRCPTRVDCVWLTGQARIAVLVQGENSGIQHQPFLITEQE